MAGNAEAWLRERDFKCNVKDRPGVSFDMRRRWSSAFRVSGSANTVGFIETIGRCECGELNP